MKTDAAVTKHVGKRDTKYVVKSRIKNRSEEHTSELQSLS